MKFKYHYLENRLWWKLDGEYSREISENNHFRTPEGIYGSDVWQLGEKEWITFTFLTYYWQITYQNGTSTYQKNLSFLTNEEIILEFTDQDLINYEK